MIISEILDALKVNTGVFPLQAIQEAISRRDEIIPGLLQSLEDVIHHADRFAEESKSIDYFAHIYAMFLLAQFREQRAFSLVIKFSRLPKKVLDDLAGDFITENLGRVIASLYDGDAEVLESLIEDSSVHEYVRAAALESLKIRVAQGEASRDDVMAYYKSLFQGRLERSYSFAWNELVACATHLHPLEVYEDIAAAYDEGLLEDFFMSMADVNKVLAMDKEKVLNHLSFSSPGYINDTIKEMHWWQCFNKEKEFNRDTPIIVPEEKHYANTSSSFETGPNAPCVCGSGKKYKKCCGSVNS